MKNNFSNLLLPLATLSLASCAGQKKEEPKRPNIIFMMRMITPRKPCLATVEIYCKPPTWTV